MTRVPAGRRDKAFVRRFLSMVKDNYKTSKQVAEYASCLCVTPSYLNQVVKRSLVFPRDTISSSTSSAGRKAMRCTPRFL